MKNALVMSLSVRNDAAVVERRKHGRAEQALDLGTLAEAEAFLAKALRDLRALRDGRSDLADFVEAAE